MKAAIITQPGGPEVLKILDVEVPEPIGEQVRVRVKASGVNRADVLQREGIYGAPSGWPSAIPGLEFAGEVDAVGSLVRTWKPGQRVMGLAGGGAQAEYLLVHEGLLVAMPDNLDFVQAAGVPEVFMTAHDALFLQADLRMGERVLIHAAGSGVGTAAIQLAKAVGATVFGTARTPAKLDAVRELGLDAGFEPQDFAREIHALTDGQGVQVVLDSVGAAYLEQNMQVLSRWGRMVILASMSGTFGKLNMEQLYAKSLSVKGVVLRTRTLEEKLTVTRAFATSVLPLLASGKIKPIIARAYPLAEIRAAHTAMGNNQNVGKMILTID